MRVYVLEHGPNCTFAEPCSTCQVENFLRLSLDEEGFKKYRALLDAATVDVEDPKKTDPLDIPIAVFLHSKRGNQKLADMGFKTVRDLMECTETDLKVKGFSNYLIGEIRSRLLNHCLVLRTQ